VNLEGSVALVAGASRGVGRGIAEALADAGAHVYASGRSIEGSTLPAAVTRVRCDHTNDAEVETFWEQAVWRWDAMMNAGVRAAFVASQHAARAMVRARRGLIANISVWSAQKHIGNVPYGVSKAATDKLTADTAHELRPHGVSVVSLYPGLVRTQGVLAAGVFDLSNSESPQFPGPAVAALATDPNLLSRSGIVVVAAALGREYGHRHRRQESVAAHARGRLMRKQNLTTPIEPFPTDSRETRRDSLLWSCDIHRVVDPVKSAAKPATLQRHTSAGNRNLRTGNWK
jgi:dehydrogenase/reductase SDR family protein 1